ncbi:hypothetical protein QL285_049136 [Trifolium repens]|nr:hypothetical protein QL285_049136 [Trifolium repens]
MFITEKNRLYSGGVPIMSVFESKSYDLRSSIDIFSDLTVLLCAKPTFTRVEEDKNFHVLNSVIAGRYLRSLAGSSLAKEDFSSTLCS